MNEQTGGVAHGANKMRDNIDNLRDDLGRIREDVGGAAKNLAGAARAGVHEAGRYASEAMSVAREHGQEAIDTTRETIRNNPLASVGIAFGAGVLLSALIRRF
jgi:ElaB/YqjD/DUF883 family membrane-anchored ribosome-binding protein